MHLNMNGTSHMHNHFQKKRLSYLVVTTMTSVLLFGASSLGKTPNSLVRANDVVRGNPNAPVTLLEYSDFTCGYCEKFFHETFPRLLSQYIDTGKVRFVYRDFPRAPGGPALHSALAARCANDQQAYWPMHDRLFNSGGEFETSRLRDYARELNLNVTEFSECLDTQRHTQDIFKDRIEGGNLGIRGTPGFVLFLTNMSQESEILLIPGAFPFDVFQEEIDKLLALASQKTPQESSPPQPLVEGA